MSMRVSHSSSAAGKGPRVSACRVPRAATQSRSPPARRAPASACRARPNYTVALRRCHPGHPPNEREIFPRLVRPFPAPASPYGRRDLTFPGTNVFNVPKFHWRLSLITELSGYYSAFASLLFCSTLVCTANARQLAPDSLHSGYGKINERESQHLKFPQVRSPTRGKVGVRILAIYKLIHDHVSRTVFRRNKLTNTVNFYYSHQLYLDHRKLILLLHWCIFV